MSRPLICLDWDGTIADSMPLCLGEIRLAMSRMGLPDLPDSRIRQCNGPTYEQSVPILGIAPERAEEFLRERMRAELELVPTVQQLFPGVRDILDSLRPHADLAIVSNGLAPYLTLSFRVLGMEDTFVRCLCSKPGRTKAQALREVLDELCPSRAVMVGDRLGDIEAGAACGIPTIAACYGYGTPEEWAHASERSSDVPALSRLLHSFALS